MGGEEKEFQFLLVRLKEYYSHPHQSSYKISIPSGTIKSTNKVRKRNNCKQISIPSGTIKRNDLYKAVAELVEFQFLLVRLKEDEVDKQKKLLLFQFLLVRLKGVGFPVIVGNRILISIPSGTIKR